MKHRSSQILFAHWNETRGLRAMPDRGEIDPGGMRGGLPDAFIVATDPLTEHPFRLAGTRVCALFGRELKAQPFLRLWHSDQREQIAALVDVVTEEAVGVVAGVSGLSAEGVPLDLELLLLPLQHGGRADARLIGTLAPLGAPYWLGAHPLGALALREHRYLGSRMNTPAPVLTFPPGARRIRHGLAVYDGGHA